MHMPCIKVITLLVCCLLFCHCQKTPKVLLISFDGFRWNYLNRIDTPNFDKLIKSGVKAKWLQDVFVSQTFPNHYTLATGLYEENHGIVANKFYDPKLNEFFSYHVKADVTSSKFWGGEPIWVTNQIQGRTSGVFFWVGSEAPIKGIFPTVYKNYNKTFPWKQRVDTVVEWLANKPVGQSNQLLNITLALLYFPQPDIDGHKYGPESPEVTEMIGQCDSITGYLLDKLSENNLYEDVNIIITSDHGMASLDKKRTVALLPYINITKVDHIINYYTGAAIWPKKGYLDSVYEDLLKIGPYASVWKREDIPAHFHYNNNNRIPPVLVAVKDKWLLLNNTSDELPMRGDHGYSNSLMDMHPFFIAHGPAFKEGLVSEPFSSVNVYELICHILGLKPAPNNGSIERVKHLLRHQPSSYPITCQTANLICISIGLSMAIFVIAFITRHFHHGKNKSHEYFVQSGDERQDEALLSYQQSEE
ncbi:ectonucleotide pyrophosphatase/phosphodiesterase family member 5-like [Clavelina lepadiformis]|uniref:ectonucleotide pyrophosphatase/phosphodiesterase family member 5-like n=1 Tax=Clavelina lepadiformis TaxID=159417 RepID=UPI004042BB6B